MPHTTPRIHASRRRAAMFALATIGSTVIAPVASAAAGPAPPAATSTAATTTIPGRCTQYEDELRRDAPPGGWDVVQMSTYMSRESSCTPTARSARDTGLLQINDINHAYLRDVLHEWVGRWSLTDPRQNIRAAAALCEYWRGRGESCYFPWKLDLFRTPGAPAGAPTASTTPRTEAVVPAPAATSTSSSPSSTSTPTTVAAPPNPVVGRCVQYEAALAANAPAAGWDVPQMSKLMATTSGCNPTKRWPTATGLLRISDSNHAWLRVRLATTVDRRTLTDPVQNIRAAAALCQLAVAQGRSCYQPWQG